MAISDGWRSVKISYRIDLHGEVCSTCPVVEVSA